MSHDSGYNIFGHLHPGVQLSGRGGESLRLPGFTGTMVVPEEPPTRTFVIGEGRVFSL